VVSRSDVDPTAYTCVHMWLGGCGFGSEVNNLISAAMYCGEHGLDCVVEDERWNSGRLHDYLQADAVVRRRCSFDGRCKMLEIKRDKRTATVGWFAVCKHAKSVPFEAKAEVARRMWRHTPATARAVRELNAELRLPQDYVAVQIRRGDKVGGARRETLKVTISDYVRSAEAQCAAAGPRRPPQVVAVCSDDVAAAEEFAAEMRRRRPEVGVRHRGRRSVPETLRRGHWQAEFNALPEDVRRDLTHEFLADVEMMRAARALVCTHSSNVGRLVALLRDGETISLDGAWTNT